MQSSFWSSLHLLLDHTDVNIEDDDETSPLELAVRHGLRQVAEKLLQCGALLSDNVRDAMQVSIFRQQITTNSINPIINQLRN